VSAPEPENESQKRAAGLAANMGSLAEDAWNRVDFRQRVVLAGLALRQGGRRVRGSFVPIVTASLAAWVAYTFSHVVLGHPMPFFAPIAAWICLGFTYNRVPRKVLEIGFGASIGVGIGELILVGLGAGAWQLAVALLLAGLIGRLLDRGDLFTIQSGVNAMVVVGMGTALTADVGAGPSRMIDALVGAGVALVFAILLPGDVLNRPRSYVGNLLTELATVFGMLGEGLRSGNQEPLRDAHAQLRGVERILDDASTVWRSSADIVALNPAMRRHRPQIDELGRQLELITRAVHTVELLLRQSRGVVDELGAVPEIAHLMDDSGAALHALSGSIRHWNRPTQARDRAIELATDCAPQTAHAMDWRQSALLSVMRSVAIDLLQLTGLSRVQARSHLPGTGPEGTGTQGAVIGDEASAVWGDDLR